MTFPLKDQDWSMDDEKEGSARNQSDPPTKGTSRSKAHGCKYHGPLHSPLGTYLVPW